MNHFTHKMHISQLLLEFRHVNSTAFAVVVVCLARIFEMWHLWMHLTISCMHHMNSYTSMSVVQTMPKWDCKHTKKEEIATKIILFGRPMMDELGRQYKRPSSSVDIYRLTIEFKSPKISVN